MREKTKWEYEKIFSVSNGYFMRIFCLQQKDLVQIKHFFRLLWHHFAERSSTVCYYLQHIIWKAYYIEFTGTFLKRSWCFQNCHNVFNIFMISRNSHNVFNALMFSEKFLIFNWAPKSVHSYLIMILMQSTVTFPYCLWCFRIYFECDQYAPDKLQPIPDLENCLYIIHWYIYHMSCPSLNTVLYILHFILPCAW